jgi:hypothetical protein
VTVTCDLSLSLIRAYPSIEATDNDSSYRLWIDRIHAINACIMEVSVQNNGFQPSPEKWQDMENKWGRGKGSFHYGFKKLTAKNLYEILRKIASDPETQRQPRPRKCRRLDGVAAILATLPRPCPISSFNVVGNETIGDAGIDHLHLLPSTVWNLDVSDFGLTPKGVEKLCNFMKDNTSIRCLIMWGNGIKDEGAQYLADMLRVNTTLQILFIHNGDIGREGVSLVSKALVINETLRSLTVSAGQEFNEFAANVLLLSQVAKKMDGLAVLDIGVLEFPHGTTKLLDGVLDENTSFTNIGFL